MGTISSRVGEAAKPVIQKLVEVRRARQGLIDTPENYHQESALCSGELLTIQDIK